ncbi:MAG: NAAT family transporter [Thermoplasmata archaeon]
MNIIFFIASFVAIFSIVNPFGSIPFFSTMTQTYTKEEKKKTLKKSIIVATLVLVVFGIGGKYIFMIFNINVDVFKIAGGILLFKVAFDMMHGKYTRSRLSDSERAEIEEKEAVGIVPLGVPLLAGPGAITTVIIYVTEKSVTIIDQAMVFVSIFIVMIISYYLLYFSDIFFKYLGKTGNQVISRIMGLILAAMSIEFIVEGIKDLI